MTSGVSRQVLVDDPEKIQFGLTHLGDCDTVRTPRAKRVTVQPPERAAAQATVRASVQGTDQTSAPVSGGRYPRDRERQRAFEVWSQLHTGQPVNAKEVLRAAQVSKDESTQVSKDESTVRRWCRAWEIEADRDFTGQEPAAGDRRSA